MKSNLSFITLLSLLFVISSCKKEEETEVTSSDTPKEIIVPDVQSTTNQNFGQSSGSQNVTVTPNQATTAQTIAPPPAPTKAGMNPAHGQPGHRCDIAVGAPLNSPPANQAKAGSAVTQKMAPFTTTTTTQTSQPSTTPAILNSDASVATAPGMNPPHGQAGHVCSVAVGAPLPKTTDSQ